MTIRPERIKPMIIDVPSFRSKTLTILLHVNNGR
jgi:hypothetical protein